MKCTIIIEKPIIKFLQSHHDIAKRFFEKMELMESNLYDLSLDIKRLQGTQDRYRLRIGKYRFLFRKDSDRFILYCYDADSR